MKKPKLKCNIIHSVVFISLITTLTPKHLLFLLHHIHISGKKETMRIIKYDMKNPHENIVSGLEYCFQTLLNFSEKVLLSCSNAKTTLSSSSSHSSRKETLIDCRVSEKSFNSS